MTEFTSIELCAGAGGQALGLEMAGFKHVALVESDPAACQTLLLNRPDWNVIEEDVLDFDISKFGSIDLLAAGIPCPPFSKAGKQLGARDERDLFPKVLELVEVSAPKVLMIENVNGLLDPKFSSYRTKIDRKLKKLGYKPDWQLLKACDYGVSQLRPRVVMIAFDTDITGDFNWPSPPDIEPPSVGELLYDLMKSNGWSGAKSWRDSANQIAPTLVGGSKKHGGPDLGPTRSKEAWKKLSVNGKSLADSAPEADFEGIPRLTPKMTARIQGFPDSWNFHGKKTSFYRQVGNAFPPPVAEAVGNKIVELLQEALVQSAA